MLIDRLMEVTRSPYPYIKLLTVLASSSSPAAAAPAPVAAPVPKQSESAPEAPVKKQPQPPAEAKPPKAPEVHTPKPAIQTGGPINFDWDKFLVAINDAAVSALLKKAGHAQDGDTLIIYAGNKFGASKLSGERLAKLHSALEAIGASGLTIDVRPDPAPPSDSRLSAIADIMGGGEEVVVDGN